MATKGCGKLKSNYTYFDDSWLILLKMDEEAITEGVDCCGIVKTSHKGFCLARLETLIRFLPGG